MYAFLLKTLSGFLILSQAPPDELEEMIALGKIKNTSEALAKIVSDYSSDKATYGDVWEMLQIAKMNSKLSYPQFKKELEAVLDNVEPFSNEETLLQIAAAHQEEKMRSRH